MATSVPATTLEHFDTFGDLLRFLRRRASLTQVELSMAVGYSHAQISRLEQNLRLPDIPTIEARFLLALGLENEPKAVARLLELAAHVRREDAPGVGISPYKGLNCFDEADAELFAGREALTARLAERVLVLASGSARHQNRFLAIIGASGSGKSSLMRAGLVPALRWHRTSTGWPIYTLTPTANPLESLAASLTDSVSRTAALADELAADHRALHLFAKRAVQSSPASRMLVIVDQFEEIFALCHAEDLRGAFIDNLLTASSAPGGSVTVVMALRADFYAHCAGYPALRQALALQQEYIGAMSDDELRRAVEEPARRGRWEFEPGLVDLILHDVGHEPGALPLLSHALLETWQRRRGHTMTFGGYASSGGVRGAIAETADAVFMDQFSLGDQAIARKIFLRLTELGDETATGDTRRRATFDELILHPGEADRTRAVLQTLADARLITTSEDSAEVAHEALIREWPRLRGWLEDNRESLRFHRHLTETSRDWASSNREPDLLYRGARLTQLGEWAQAHSDELNELELEFIGASQAAAEQDALAREAGRQRELDAARKLAEEQAHSADRLRARNRLLRAFIAAATVLALVAGWFSLQSSANARRAQADFSRAESLRLAAESQALLSENGDPQTAALLSIRALQTEYSIQADSALQESLGDLYNRQIFRGHSGWINAVSFSSDGRYALTGSQDGSARIWDAQTGQEIRRFVDPQAGISRVAFSPDGARVITGNNDGTARVWDAITGRELLAFVPHAGGISALVFSPDGRYLLTAGADNAARLWNASSFQEVRAFVGHAGFVSSVAFSAAATVVVTGSYDKTVRVWDVATGEELQTYTSTHHVTGVDISPDGSRVLASSEDDLAWLWDSGTGQVVCTLAGHTKAVNGAAFSVDGSYILTGSDDHTARVWDARSCLEVRRFVGNEAAVRSAAFSPDGQYVLAGGQDGIGRLWAAPAGVPLRTISATSSDLTDLPADHPTLAGRNVLTARGIASIAVSPDGRYILAGGEDHVARLWESATGREVRKFLGHSGTVHSVAFSADGKYVLTGSYDFTARLWDAETARQLRSLSGNLVRVPGAVFSPDGRNVLTIGVGEVNHDHGQAVVAVWDAGTGRTVRILGIGAALNSNNFLALSADGMNLLISSNNGADMIDVASGLQIHNFPSYAGDLRSLAFSPDGRYVLTGNVDKTARLWDAATGQQVRIFSHPSGTVLAVAFSPDGSLVLTGMSDGTAHLWDTSTGEELRQFSVPRGAINAVAFSPDGKWMAAGSADGTVRQWDTDVRDTVRFACSLLWRDLTTEERAQYGIEAVSSTCTQN